MPDAPLAPSAAGSRLVADRRGGLDRRSAPRRLAVTSVRTERRALVDRRRGPERRSTLERRGRRGSRQLGTESPGEHVRNALQMLGAGSAPDLEAAVTRLQRALDLLERRAP